MGGAARDLGWQAGWMDALWLQFWCIFNMFSGFGLIRWSDAWIFMDFDRFLMIFIDFKVSWRLGCSEALIFLDFH